MITLHNVIDTRTGKFHSTVIVKERLARYFVPAEEEVEQSNEDSQSPTEDNGGELT